MIFQLSACNMPPVQDMVQRAEQYGVASIIWQDIEGQPIATASGMGPTISTVNCRLWLSSMVDWSKHGLYAQAH